MPCDLNGEFGIKSCININYIERRTSYPECYAADMGTAFKII
jgi:hypothetical protein